MNHKSSAIGKQHILYHQQDSFRVPPLVLGLPL